jgi:uncharacterized protein
MNVAITGASGFIGNAVLDRLREEGYLVRAVSTRTPPSTNDFKNCDAVIHLAGEPVAQRWTRAARQRIRESRVEGTRAVVNALRADPPAVLVSASAVGYYGSRGDEELTESSAPGDDFLAHIAIDWEREARAAEEFGVRVVAPRISVVLGRDGGAIPKMLVPFKLGVGGRIGSGRQWMPWIHIHDMVSLILFALENEPLSGPVNAAAPTPATNSEFTWALARALHRPALFPVPRLALRLLYGRMATMLYSSERVIPEAATHAGFEFRYPEIGQALESLF